MAQTTEVLKDIWYILSHNKPPNWGILMITFLTLVDLRKKNHKSMVFINFYSA